ncbi:MAG TPA: hypothetical protein VJ161_12655 [Geobacteraceae bacterium]|nr:hypothetical protein [Geobacteraceae bacterium]
MTSRDCAMAIPVIFTNSTAGMIEAYLLDDLINQGRIVAYKISGDWVRIGGKTETAEEVLSEPPIKDAKTSTVNGTANEQNPSHSAEKRSWEDKGMMIGVIYKNNKRGMIDEYLLDDLIKEGKINAFRRSSGWVKIGHDPIRERWKPSKYNGQERRKHELPPDYFL